MKHLGTILAVLLMGGALILVVLSSTSGGAYSLTISEVLKNKGALQGHELRVAGTVVQGSLAQGTTPFDHRFLIEDEQGKRVLVNYHGALPDPFKEGRHVIVQGVLEKDGTLMASQLIVKCPSKYVEKGKDESSNYQYYLKKYEQGHPKD